MCAQCLRSLALCNVVRALQKVVRRAFLRTHPLTSERIADVSNRVSQMSYRQVPDSVEFQYVRAKLIANNGSADTNIEVFAQNIREHRYTNEAAEHYGLAVAYLRKNALSQSRKRSGLVEKERTTTCHDRKPKCALASGKEQSATSGQAICRSA